MVGVGAASLGAVLSIVLAGCCLRLSTARLGSYSARVFFGGWAATLILYHAAMIGGRTSVATMLLAGIALAARLGR